MVVLAMRSAPARETPPPPPDWELAAEYPSAESWDHGVALVEDRLARFAQRRGARITSAHQLAGLLDEARDLRGRAGNLARYALLTRTLDTTNDLAQARYNAATGLEARVEAAVGWLDSATVALGARRIRTWQRTEPRLARHGWRLARALNTVGHQWPTGSEPAYAALQRNSIGASDLYDAMMAADTAWPSIKDSDGNDVVVNPDSLDGLVGGHETAVRRRAIDAYYTHLKAVQRPLGLLLTRKFENDLILARARHYANSFDAFFGAGDGMPPDAWRQMVDAARSNVPLLTRYARILARLHRVADIRYAELNLPPPAVNRHVPLDEAKAIAVDAAAPFGAEYQHAVRECLDRPWYDFAPRPHKDRGALGVYWQVGGGHPYGIMSYDGTLRDAQTLAAISAVTMFYAHLPAAKSPERREEDFPIYGNAVWWSGSLMATDFLIAHASNRDERMALLAGDLRRLWNAFFVGAIDADFEDRVNRVIVDNHAPTGAEFSQLYLATLRDYYRGDGAAAVDDLSGGEWMTLANEYYGHVFAEWSFAIAGAATIAERARAGDMETIRAIAFPLHHADSYTSYDLMRDIGADPVAATTYDAVMRRMARDIDALERELSMRHSAIPSLDKG